MSNKAKNLTYEMEEPVFLRRLRQQHAGGGGPDRYVAPRNRKTAADDDEDAPTYVLEGAENETISREEFKAMTSGKGEVKGEEKEEVNLEKSGENQEAGEEIKTALSRKESMGGKKKESVIDIGAKGKKRKIAKIGGGDETEEKEEKAQDKKAKSNAGKKAKKPVKLSFDEE